MATKYCVDKDCYICKQRREAERLKAEKEGAKMVTPGVGDKISVTRDDLEVTEVRGGRVWTKDSEGGVRSYYLDKVSLTVTKKAVKQPAYWPPKADDVWKSELHGRVFHIVGTRAFRLSFGDISSPYDTASLLRDYPDLTLQFRNYS